LKTKATSSPISELGEEILNYLGKHVEAGDTVEGIVQWWLLEQRIEQGISETKRELQGLVAKELLQEVPVEGGRVYYRLNPTKQEEIQRTLDGKNKRTELWPLAMMKIRGEKQELFLPAMSARCPRA